MRQCTRGAGPAAGSRRGRRGWGRWRGSWWGGWTAWRTCCAARLRRCADAVGLVSMATRLSVAWDLCWGVLFTCSPSAAPSRFSTAQQTRPAHPHPYHRAPIANRNANRIFSETLWWRATVRHTSGQPFWHGCPGCACSGPDVLGCWKGLWGGACSAQPANLCVPRTDGYNPAIDQAANPPRDQPPPPPTDSLTRPP